MECSYAPLLVKVKLEMAMVRFATLVRANSPQAPGGTVYSCGLCMLDGYQGDKNVTLVPKTNYELIHSRFIEF